MLLIGVIRMMGVVLEHQQSVYVYAINQGNSIKRILDIKFFRNTFRFM